MKTGIPLLFILFFSYTTIFASDIGSTGERIVAVYGQPSSAKSEENGVESVIYSYVVRGRPEIRATFVLINNIVEKARYEIVEERPLADWEIKNLLRVAGIGPPWTIIESTSADGVNLVQLARRDGALAGVLTSTQKSNVIVHSAKWLKMKNDYDSKPWYKKIF